MGWRELTPEEEKIMVHRGTEPPFSGEYNDHFEPGVYACRRCGTYLYRSEYKFRSRCGWPSFDDEIHGAVKRRPDPDGIRTEIVCATCGAHLGHVFWGEGYTLKNLRHCVNSLSLVFIPADQVVHFECIVLGGGCFWCTEAVFQQVPGVRSVVPGYAGGKTTNPTYSEVCGGDTGHAEVVKVVFDPASLSLRRILEVFFTVHDPTTPDCQGADQGSQYRSIVLFTSEEQERVVRDFIREISGSFPAPVVTEVKELEAFYPAEEYHRKYYDRNPKAPYCRMVIAPKLGKFKKLFRQGGMGSSVDRFPG